jgi:hypothetical protein
MLSRRKRDHALRRGYAPPHSIPRDGDCDDYGVGDGVVGVAGAGGDGVAGAGGEGVAGAGGDGVAVCCFSSHAARASPPTSANAVRIDFVNVVIKHPPV